MRSSGMIEDLLIDLFDLGKWSVRGGEERTRNVTGDVVLGARWKDRVAVGRAVHQGG